LLQSIVSAQLCNYFISVSHDSKFLALGSKLTDVKVWELHTKKSGEFDKAELAMTLKGHRRGVKCLAFGKQSIVTASVDGAWREFDIAVRYQQKEDPKCRQTHQTSYTALECITTTPATSSTNQTPIVVYSAGSAMEIATNTGHILFSFPHAHKGTITALVFNEQGDKFASVGEKTITVWKVPNAK
jgi:WD40 repeat protein